MHVCSFFASFVDRDSSHMMLTRLWQAVAGDNPLTDEDVDQIIACEYGEGDEADIFEGSENRLTMYQTYTWEFQCKYELQRYPFDTQVN